MPSRTLPPPTWVATSTSLEKLAVELAHYPRLAVDTESNSLHAFREQLCLIQFSTPRVDFLVDPLAWEIHLPLVSLKKTLDRQQYLPMMGR